MCNCKKNKYETKVIEGTPTPIPTPMEMKLPLHELNINNDGTGTNGEIQQSEGGSTE